MIRRAALAWVLLCAACLAGEPQAVLSGPPTAAVGAPVLLSVAGSVGDTLRFVVNGPAEVAVARLYGEDGTLLYGLATAPAPGRYTFGLAAISEAGQAVDLAIWDVAIGSGPTPLPPPGPDPVPPAPDPPPPPVVTGRLHVSYIVDAQQVTPAEAAIRTDPAVRAGLATLDAAWHTYQSTEEDLDRLHLRTYIAKVGYPALVIQDATGKVVAARRVISADEVLDAVRAVRGGKINP